MLNDDEISRCRARMEAISEIRPSSMELFNEYAELKTRVMQLEFEALAYERQERAISMTECPITWDLRTENVHIYFDALIRRRAHVIFTHADSVREQLSKVSVLRFSRIAAVKAERLAFTDNNLYVCGITGIANLGMFEVLDSNWKVIEPGCGRHFVLVFANLVVQVLAQDFDSVTSQERLSAVVRSYVDIETQGGLA